MREIETFISEGLVEFGPVIDAGVCREIVEGVRASRRFDEGLFLPEASYRELRPTAFNKNPRPGCNHLDLYAGRLDGIERHPLLSRFFEALLGPGWSVLRRKLVCGMPETRIPGWILDEVRGRPCNNLAHYIRPEYTDITYFYGIDYHQDLVDWRERDADFVTLYVYLEDVGPHDAPLYVMPGSHILGGARFPHRLARIDEGSWLYVNDEGEAMRATARSLLGPAGSANCWHACTLHGTQPDRADRERISIRYLLQRGHDDGVHGIDRANALLRGPIRMADLREDLDESGLPVMHQNVLYDLGRTPPPA